MRTGTAVAAALAAVVAGGGGAVAQPPAAEATESDERNDGYRLRAWAMFSSPDEDPPAAAVTYDPSLVPQGSRVEVEQRVADGRTTITLAVSGVRPGHTFGAHVHTDACGARPADSGPHYRNIEGEDPSLANAENEVWLDVTADGRGTGRSTAVQEWTFRPGEAASVVLHERATSDGHEGHGAPGEAGGRVACVTVPFGRLAAADVPDGGQGAATPAVPAAAAD
ncbi:superoxide dismutase family protein, partial [Streptomyces spiramenti]